MVDQDVDVGGGEIQFGAVVFPKDPQRTELDGVRGHAIVRLDTPTPETVD